MQKTLASWLYILKRDSTKDSLLYSRMFNSTLFPDPSWLKWSAFQYGHSWVKTYLTSYSQRLPKCTGVKVHLSSNTSSSLRLLGSVTAAWGVPCGSVMVCSTRQTWGRASSWILCRNTRPSCWKATQRRQGALFTRSCFIRLMVECMMHRWKFRDD